MHIVAVIGLQIVGLERHALHAKAVVARDQRLGDFRVLDAPPNPVRDIGGEFGVGRLIHKDLFEIGEPDAEAGLLIELVPQRQPLLPRHLVKAAAVGFVLKTSR